MNRILLAHGGGGSLTQELVQQMFVPAFKMRSLDDAAVLGVDRVRLAFTTDS